MTRPLGFFPRVLGSIIITSVLYLITPTTWNIPNHAYHWVGGSWMVYNVIKWVLDWSIFVYSLVPTDWSTIRASELAKAGGLKRSPHGLLIFLEAFDKIRSRESERRPGDIHTVREYYRSY